MVTMLDFIKQNSQGKHFPKFFFDFFRPSDGTRHQSDLKHCKLSYSPQKCVPSDHLRIKCNVFERKKCVEQQHLRFSLHNQSKIILSELRKKNSKKGQLVTKLAALLLTDISSFTRCYHSLFPQVCSNIFVIHHNADLISFSIDNIMEFKFGNGRASVNALDENCESRIH